MRAAIVGLVRGHKEKESYRPLLRRNRLLYKNFNHRFGFPVIIFHEGNISQEHQDLIGQSSPNVQFIDVGGTDFVRRHELPGESAHQAGYKHMCRFYAIGIYRYIAEYDMVMRLDDDSYIQSRIAGDLFQRLWDAGCDYAYLHAEFDNHPETLATLPAFSQAYARSQGIAVDPTSLDMLHFYSNFHVTRVSFWLRDDVQEYLRAVDESQGIYRYRWGDHVIQAHALKMFSQPGRVTRLDGFKYWHGSHRWGNYRTAIAMRAFDKVRRLTRRLARKVRAVSGAR
jgi:hypothetical protein